MSFTKGCYVGQELVARIDSRGRVNRRLVGMAVTENVMPPPGSEVFVQDVVVGTLSTVGESLTVGTPVALGMVRHEVEPGDLVVIRWATGATTAEVRSLPMDDFSATSHSSYNKDRN